MQRFPPLLSALFCSVPLTGYIKKREARAGSCLLFLSQTSDFIILQDNPRELGGQQQRSDSNQTPDVRDCSAWPKWGARLQTEGGRKDGKTGENRTFRRVLVAVWMLGCWFMGDSDIGRGYPHKTRCSLHFWTLWTLMDKQEQRNGAQMGQESGRKSDF